MTKKSTFDDELAALSAILAALEPLEDDKRQFVMRTASDRLGLVDVAGDERGEETGETLTGGTPKSGKLASTTPKEFLAQKQPKTDAQRVACLAFYLCHARGEPHFKTVNISKLNTEAACPKFSNAAVAVDNATNRSHLLAPAGKGQKQITDFGEKVVDALPDHDQVKELAASARKPRRRKPSKKKSPKKR